MNVWLLSILFHLAPLMIVISHPPSFMFGHWHVPHSSFLIFQSLCQLSSPLLNLPSSGTISPALQLFLFLLNTLPHGLCVPFFFSLIVLQVSSQIPQWTSKICLQ